MGVTTANILVGAGIMKIGAYGGATADVGATTGGVEVAMDRSFLDTKTDQYKGTIKKNETDRKMTVKTTLMEATLANLAIAMGYPTTAVSGGTFKLGAGPASTEKKVEFVGTSPTGTTRTYTLWKCVSIGNAGHSYKKDGETVVPIELEVLVDPSQAAGEEFGKIADA